MADGGQASRSLSSIPPPAEPDPLIGRVVNERYRIVSLIARGGMGKVYRAEQAPLGRICALKVLTPTYQGDNDPEFNRRFFLEASIASRITHPNSVTIFDYGQTDDDIYYMAMEYLEGLTLHRAIRMAGFLPEDRVLHISRQVCRALRAAHALGCIHRDLKPANIFLTQHGDEPDFVKVLDFGLVKNIEVEANPEDQLTQAGLFMGSPKYMAPEQIRGERVDARTDVYSLGVIMFEMLSGKPPFDRPTSLMTLMAHVNDPVPGLRQINPLSSTSRAVEELVNRCMSKDPADRPASMDEVLGSLKRISGLTAATTGEFRVAALVGEATSGHYEVGKANGRDTYPGGPPEMASEPPTSAPTTAGPLTRPSLTPMLDAAGGGARSLSPTEGSSGRALGTIVGSFLLAATLLGLVGFLVLRLRASPSADGTTVPPLAPASVAAGPEATTPLPTPVAPEPTPPAAPVAAVQPTTVHFVTDPPGAVIHEGNVVLCDATPCDYEFAGDVAAEHKVTVAHVGFKSETRNVLPSDGQLTITMAPIRAIRTASPSAPRSEAARPSPSGSSAPQGFKDIPY